VHAAHVLFKGQVVCSSDDENIKDIYDHILSFNPLSSTEEVNKVLSEKYPGYSVRFISDSLYGLHNIVMSYKAQELGQKDWVKFDLEYYFSEWECCKSINELIQMSFIR
jgi:hypothetical protein